MKKAWLSFFSGEAWVANPLMLSPAMGCLLIFFIFPMIATVVVSFTDWELGGTNSVHFIGWTTISVSGRVMTFEKAWGIRFS